MQFLRNKIIYFNLFIQEKKAKICTKTKKEGKKSHSNLFGWYDLKM